MGEMVVNNSELLKNKARIKELFEKLRNKLIGFDVINLRGQNLGRIQDFILDKYRRLYVLIHDLDSPPGSPVYVLSSKYIQNIDTSNRSLFVDISLAKFNQLPTYQVSRDKATAFSQDSEKPPVPPANLTDSSERQNVADTHSSNYQPVTTDNSEAGDTPLMVRSDYTPEVAEEQTIRLLEERLLVNRSKRKIGEVVIRKQIETRIVEVPIQSERLVIEKVGSESQEPVEVENLPVDHVSGAWGTEMSGQPAIEQPFTTPTNQFENIDNPNFSESENASEVVEEEMIRLLEERLVVNRSKWKVGEVVARKEVENQVVRVPIRREKLIIEQVSPELKQIAEIDLGNGEVIGVDLRAVSSLDRHEQSVSDSEADYNVIGEFLSPKAASNLLEAIALQGRPHGCAKIRVELVVDDPQLQATYQNMFDRCSQR
jgi:stress response protein YsnF